jgi:3-oxoacyl-[acyl-carrier-protein] synthase-3
VSIRGLVSAVPATDRSWETHREHFGDEAGRIADATGVHNRPIVAEGQCASDLCAAAAEELLDGLGWSRDTVGLLVFVSQTPDHVLPATACVLQERLRLSTGCAAFDVQLGCSGYVYGIWMASHLLASGAANRAIVLVGDTISRLVSPTDRATAMLFGDAGSATALERNPSAPPIAFRLGTDGTGAPHLKVAAGGFRGSAADEQRLFMDGAEVFAFAQEVLPGLVGGVLDDAGETMATIDHAVFHQANTFMLKHFTKRLRIAPEKMVVAMEGFGNTSSASIPLAMSSALNAQLGAGPVRLLLCGFGVGWSWAAAVASIGPVFAPPILRVGL